MKKNKKKDRGKMVQKEIKANILDVFGEIAHDIFMKQDQLLDVVDKISDKGKVGEELDVEETVHDIRVNFRRLISLFYFYKPLVRRKARIRLQKDLKTALGSFESDRTFHIFNRAITKYGEAMTTSATSQEAEDMDVLLKKALELREKGYFRNMGKKSLDPGSKEFGDSYRSLKERILENEGKLFKHRAFGLGEDLTGFRQRRYLELMEKFKKKERELDLEDMKEVHRLRIKGKNIFYTVKYFEQDLGEEAKNWSKHLRDIQDIAGRVHDAEVNLQIAEDMGKEQQVRESVQRLREHLLKDKEMKVVELKELINPATKITQ